MLQFSHFAVKKLYFKQNFSTISGNRGPLFLQINFDCTYLGGGGFSWGVFSMGEILSSGFLSGVYVWGLYVLEPLQDSFST